MSLKPFRFLADPGDVSDGPSLVAAARRAESIGYSVLVYADHVVIPFGFLPLLATVAAVTDRLRVSPFVVNNDLRHPALLAQDLATLDVLSGGRVEVAVGAGWNRPEYDALGSPNRWASGSRAAEAVGLGLLRWAFSLDGEHCVTNHDGCRSPSSAASALFIGGGDRP
jgi:alkanesulfonate monooxygenase SsuD/methylene tetrahydromethanopterin reductase-like flavin-dependent oxidoreductase (luciferase family)